jgi:hypothetical protein
MISRPPYLPILLGVWLIPLLIGLIVDPYGSWTYLLTKPAVAAYRLREAATFDRNSYFASGGQEAWREVLRSPEAEFWFRAVATKGLHPAGRLYGLAGLYAIDRQSLLREVEAHPPFGAHDSVIIDADNGSGWVPASALLRPATLDTIIKVFRDASPRPNQ